jgi:hypothetical protein
LIGDRITERSEGYGRVGACRSSSDEVLSGGTVRVAESAEKELAETQSFDEIPYQLINWSRMGLVAGLV